MAIPRPAHNEINIQCKYIFTARRFIVRRLCPRKFSHQCGI